MPGKPQNLLRSRCLRRTVGARSGWLQLSPPIFLPLVHAHHRHIACVRKCFGAKAGSVQSRRRPAAAVLWALHLVALERWSRAGHLYGLTVIQLATSATVALGCQVLLDDWQGFTPPMSVPAAAGIIFLGAGATGGAFISLSWAQTRLDTTTTAVILTLEPLAGAGLGAALGDAWTATTLAGAITLITAVCLVARPSGQTTRGRSGCHQRN